jgi:hypothetical protein
MKNLVRIFTLLLLSPLIAFATGDQKGNGGNIIVCDSNGKKTYELLDLYEGRASVGLSYVSAAGADVAEILEQRIKNLDRWNPKRGILYRSYFKEFQKEALFVPEGQFTAVGDTGPAVYPKECELKQIVVQWDRPTPTGYRYLINQDLWNALSPEQRAALLLHEFIYREGRRPQNDFGNSLGVRYFTAYLHSTLATNSTLKSYIDQLRYVGFQEAEAQGMSIWLYTWNQDHSVKKDLEIEFHSDNVVASASLADHFTIPEVLSPGQEFTCSLPIQGEHSVGFYLDGKLAIVNSCVRAVVGIKSELGQGEIWGNHFHYDQQGRIDMVESTINTTPTKRAVFMYNVLPRGLLAWLRSEDDIVQIKFYPGTRSPESLWMMDYSALKDTNNELVMPRNLPVNFDSHGAIQDPAVQAK